MSALRYRVKLSKGSLLLLHLTNMGHVWRDDKKGWVASTENTSRCVDERIRKMIDQGVLVATYRDNFPKLTQMGLDYMADHPLEDALAQMIR